MKFISFIIVTTCLFFQKAVANNEDFISTVAPGWTLDAAYYATDDVRFSLKSGERVLFIDLSLCDDDQAAKSRFDKLASEMSKVDGKSIGIGDASVDLLENGNEVSVLLFKRGKFVCRLQGGERKDRVLAIGGRMDSLLQRKSEIVEDDLKVHRAKQKEIAPILKADGAKEEPFSEFPGYFRELVGGPKLRMAIAYEVNYGLLVEIYLGEEQTTGSIFIRICENEKQALNEYSKVMGITSFNFQACAVGDRGLFRESVVKDMEDPEIEPVTVSECHWVRGNICVSISGAFDKGVVLSKSIAFDRAILENGLDRISNDINVGFDQ